MRIFMEAVQLAGPIWVAGVLFWLWLAVQSGGRKR